ncbi:Hypothetical predicted protein [Paramuricea clavata]|uniref:Uncharacterized protein n=1 Tax=Paramuricea clavata TaxID=317549 RepID=A0A7D9I5D9_PARCT|nr:Hypothetical predicted protein [Paramuricea clavata]
MAIGLHELQAKRNEKFYDGIHRDWATKFSRFYSYMQSKPTGLPSYMSRKEISLWLGIGWALKPGPGNTRFTENIQSYLTAKYNMGERIGRKADPERVASEMRSAKNEKSERRFKREEWLSKTQIAGFFFTTFCHAKKILKSEFFQ